MAMIDFRLKVFVSVARNLNFTRASKELFISQPAISKHIKELESEFKTPLFNRMGNRIELTAAGELLLPHAEAILESYRELEARMNNLTGNFSGELCIGASTTISQYVLPKIMADFMRQYPHIHLSLSNGNSTQIEEMLGNNQIDLGLVEGNERKHDLHYISFMKDELVLVTNAQGVYAQRDKIDLQDLKSIPLVLREIGSGTLNVIEDALQKHNIRLQDLHILIQLGSTESIKFFLRNSDCVAIVSVVAVAHELFNNTLKIIDINDLAFEREFAFVTRHGSTDKLAEQFMRFALKKHT